MKLKYTFKTDTLFKMLFVQNPDLLKKLVAALMRIPVESIQEFVIRNPNIAPEDLGKKFCRLDINMFVNGRLVDLEVQICNEGDYPERVMYYWAREFSSALPAGEGYAVLPRTIIISIIDFNMFDCEEFYSCFQPLEVSRHTLLSDKMGFQFFELRKLPDNIDEKDNLLLWLSLFKANTEEELEKIKLIGGSEMEQAVNAYYTITGSSEFQERERMREKARHDEAQALYHAENVGLQKGLQQGRQEGLHQGRREGILETAKKLIGLGLPFDTITQATGLSSKEIERLQADN